MFAKCFLPNSDACDLQPAVSNFAARDAILAHAASHVTFYGYFESTSTEQYSTKFFRSLGFISRQIPLFMVVTPCCKFSKNDV